MAVWISVFESNRLITGWRGCNIGLPLHFAIGLDPCFPCKHNERCLKGLKCAASMHTVTVVGDLWAYLSDPSAQFTQGNVARRGTFLCLSTESFSLFSRCVQEQLQWQTARNRKVDQARGAFLGLEPAWWVPGGQQQACKWKLDTGEG